MFSKLTDIVTDLEDAASFNVSEVPSWLLDYNRDLQSLESTLNSLKSKITSEFEALKESQTLIHTLDSQKSVLEEMLSSIPEDAFKQHADNRVEEDIPNDENHPTSNMLPNNAQNIEHEVVKTEPIKDLKESKKKTTTLALITQLEYEQIPK